MSETPAAPESIPQSLSKVFAQIYKDWGKDILFVLCLTIILFTTQAVLLPQELLLTDLNWKACIIVIGLSLYWYVVSILTVVSLYLCLVYIKPKNELLQALSNSLTHFAFVFSVLILIATAFVFYLIRLFVPYNEWFHFAFFLLAHVPVVWLLYRSWYVIMKNNS